MGSEAEGYRFYNKAAGPAQILALSNSTEGDGENSNASMISYPYTSESTSDAAGMGYLFLPESSSLSTESNRFYLKGVEGGLKYYLNKRYRNGDENTHYLAYWRTNQNTMTDAGCAFKFTAVDDYCAALTAVQQLIVEKKDKIGQAFGFTQDLYDRLVAAFNQYKDATDQAAATTALNELLDEVNARSVYFPDGQKIILKNRERDGYYMRVKDDSKSNTGHSLGAGNLPYNYRYLFTLRANADFSGYKLFSDYFGQYVGQTPTNENSEYLLVDNADDAQDFFIAPAATSGYYTFSDKGWSDTKGVMHMAGMSGDNNWQSLEGGIVRWEASSEASQFDIITDLTEAYELWDGLLTDEAAKVGSNIGYYEPTEALTAALEAFNAATDDKGVKAKALEEALNEARHAPVTGRYYTIDNAVTTGKVIVEDYNAQADGNNLLLNTTTPTNLVPALWQFEEVERSGYDRLTPLYSLKAANSGNYMSKVSWEYNVRMFPANDENIGKYDIYSRRNGADTGQPMLRTEGAVLLVHYANEARSDYGTVADRGSNNGHLDSWNDASNDNNWIISEVTEIPVNISTVGYATLNLPFAVTVPEGVKAYTGTETDTEVRLTDIGSAIPANTPVILTAEGKDTPYMFPIAYDNTDTAPTNALSGTLVPETIAESATVYILADGNDGIGMYKVTSATDRTIPANKAYLGSTAGTSAAAMKSFNFGQVTGIGSVTTENAAADTYFDLQGRRVLYPAHGVFVKGNGQKVYIK